MASKTLGYNTPSIDASLRLSSKRVSSCEVDTIEDNVLKTSFRDLALQTAWWSLFHDVLTPQTLTD